MSVGYNFSKDLIVSLGHFIRSFESGRYLAILRRTASIQLHRIVCVVVSERGRRGRVNQFQPLRPQHFCKKKIVTHAHFHMQLGSLPLGTCCLKTNGWCLASHTLTHVHAHCSAESLTAGLSVSSMPAEQHLCRLYPTRSREAHVVKGDAFAHVQNNHTHTRSAGNTRWWVSGFN